MSMANINSAILEHCHHKVLYVEDITQHSAVLHWKIHHTVTKVIEDYKVANCLQQQLVNSDITYPGLMRWCAAV